MKEIKRYTDMEDQLAKLTDLCKEDAYVGAGLTIGLTVGPRKAGEPHEVEVEISEPTSMDAIIDALLRGVRDSLGLQHGLLKLKQKELSEFFASVTFNSIEK